MAQVPLATEAVDDLVAGAPAGDVGNELAEQTVDAPVVGLADRRDDQVGFAAGS